MATPRKATVTKEVKNEDINEIREAMLIDCPSKDCKAQIKDHEVRIRQLEIDREGTKHLIESIARMNDRNEETSKATINTLSEISQAVIRVDKSVVAVDGKVDLLVERDRGRELAIGELDRSLSAFKDSYHKNEDESKIDIHKIGKAIFEKALYLGIGGGAVYVIMEAAKIIAK